MSRGKSRGRSALFVCAVCIYYGLDLFHQNIVVVLIINATEHWVAYNIAISVNEYRCRKCHDL